MSDASRSFAYVNQHQDPFATLYRVALRIGARKGELLALRVNDRSVAISRRTSQIFTMLLEVAHQESIASIIASKLKRN